MKKMIPLFLLLYVMACHSDAKDHTNAARDTIPLSSDDSLKVSIEAAKKDIAAQMANSEITYFVIKVPDEKYGYSIFIDGKMYIEQKTIPALEGNNGFSKKEDAEKVAQLVIEKIKAGEMPPTITVEDLKRLNIISK